MLTGEFRAIERLRALLPPPPPGQTWIGDDAAVVPPPAGPLLLTADVVVEGVHADLSRLALDDLGWKAITANVSDIAAMGGRPLHALVSVAAPAHTDLDLLYQGIAQAARHYACPVVGGDLSNGPVVVASVAVTGTVDGDPVLRSGARPGDSIYVTGELGRAAASEWRHRAVARLAQGESARRAGATAMIDVSDGLVADLNHLATASAVGYELIDVPVAPGATLQQALHGGEDYELIFTAPSADLPVGVRIGTCTEDLTQRVPGSGWEHEFG